ncbi:MAG: SPOR domain-containing protein [Treponema sp.]|jgi:hypothetical protein|nr:SPOR domain-containing protein [Treponema sp.]
MKQLSGLWPLWNTLIVMAVSLSFTGASVWEGAAALAPRGDLPEDGYYAATNSFPTNTVVDITNLETGRSIRAIVAAGLTTPGLLAVLSPDAAERIGLGTKTIGRIRMTQPEDPIAFARFTEGLAASGDPDYDPAAMLAAGASAAGGSADGKPADGKPADEIPAAVQTAQAAETPRGTGEPARQSEIPPSPPPRTLEDPDYAEYSQSSIVSVGANSAASTPPGQAADGNFADGKIADEWEEDWDDRSYSAYASGDADSPERTSYLIWEQGGSVGTPEAAPPRAQAAAPVQAAPVATPPPEQVPERVPEREAAVPQDPWEAAWSETSSSRFVAEARSDAKTSGAESSAQARLLIQQPVQPATQPAAQVPPQSPVGEYTLVPAEERPPVRDPASPPRMVEAPPAQPVDSIDESLFIDSIEKVREDRARAAEAARLAEEQRAAEEAARRAEEQRAAEAARLAEEQRAAEAARLAEEQRAAEATRLAEEQRAAETARPAEERRVVEAPEVIVILPKEAGEPQGPWVDPMAEPPPPPPPEPPEILVNTPEEPGDPQGPWIVEPSREVPPEPPLELTLITPVSPQVPPEQGTDSAFSVPVNVITEMEKGKYYVQLGAFRSIASVESALLTINPGYPLNVQNSGSADEPMYRLLVGPVNLGESGALVRRFKGSGYRDAYIRSGG